MASEDDSAEARVGALRARIAAAPTPALKAKFERQLAELHAAQGGPSDDDLDLPVVLAVGAAAPAEAGPSETAGEVLCETSCGEVRAAAGADGRALAILRPTSGDPQAFLARAESVRLATDGDPAGVLDVRGAPGAAAVFARPAGKSLRAELEEGRRVRRRLPVEACVDDIAGVATWLAARGFAHGDLGPDTLFRDATGSLRPLAFGRCEDRVADPGDDQLRLAQTLWELLTGSPAGPGDRELGQHRTEAPASLRKALFRALSPTPSERYPAMAAFATALRPVRRTVPIVGPMLARLPPERRNQVLVGGAIAAVGLLVILTYPLWQAAAPWQAANDKREATRLAAIVRVLAQRVDADTAQVRDAAVEATRERDRLQEKLQSARDSATYHETLGRYIEASLLSSRLERVQAAYETQTAAERDAAGLQLAEANSLLTAGDSTGARRRFEGLKVTYEQMRALPAKLRGGALAEEARAAEALTGRWGRGDCAAPSEWRFEGRVLSVSWPGVGQFKERFLGVHDGTIYTQGVSPAETAGKFYGYAVQPTTAVVEELGRQGAQMRIVRCGP